jgi:hypothetical protein
MSEALRRIQQNIDDRYDAGVERKVASPKFHRAMAMNRSLINYNGMRTMVDGGLSAKDAAYYGSRPNAGGRPGEHYAAMDQIMQRGLGKHQAFNSLVTDMANSNSAEANRLSEKVQSSVGRAQTHMMNYAKLRVRAEDSRSTAAATKTGLNAVRGNLDAFGTMSPKAEAVTRRMTDLHYAREMIKSGMGFALVKNPPAAKPTVASWQATAKKPKGDGTVAAHQRKSMSKKTGKVSVGTVREHKRNK